MGIGRTNSYCLTSIFIKISKTKFLLVPPCNYSHEVVIYLGAYTLSYNFGLLNFVFLVSDSPQTPGVSFQMIHPQTDPDRLEGGIMSNEYLYEQVG